MLSATRMATRLATSATTTPLTRSAIRHALPSVARSFTTARALRSQPTLATATVTPAAKQNMSCFQCEQTANQTGCKTVGVCGKTPEVAALQDLLVYSSVGIAAYANAIRQISPETFDTAADQFVLTALFSTMTNVNFDNKRMISYLQEAIEHRDRVKSLYQRVCKEKGVKDNTEALERTQAGFSYNITGNEAESLTSLLTVARTVGVEERKIAVGNADIFGLQELLMYGIKGLCAYFEHAIRLAGSVDNAIMSRIVKHLTILTRTADLGEMFNECLAAGETNFLVMEALEKNHIARFGVPEPTQVETTPRPGKCIVVSGHDMLDLEQILKATEGTGINVYTHGEMLPAHSYPKLKAYKHLAGHYGSAWQLQRWEFSSFPGAIVMTSNCIMEPLKSYKNNIFTTNVVGFAGVTHLKAKESHLSGRAPSTDFTPVLKAAQNCDGFEEDDITPTKPLTVGFGKDTILNNAPAIVDAINKGAIKHFFLIGGCDGSEGERNYFTNLAKATPSDSVILTLGCGKYKFNRLNLGSIGPFPRVLDMGQCNDAYGAIQVAVALSKALNTPVNQLPLSFAISWLEQKAVAVFLTMLHFNLQNIRLGPHLPAFLTPNLLQVLVQKYKVKPIQDKNVAEDLKNMLAGQ